MADEKSRQRTGIVGFVTSLGTLLLGALVVLVMVAGAVAVAAVVAVLVRYEVLGDLDDLGVGGGVLTVVSIVIALGFVVVAGKIWQSERNEGELSLLRRIGRRASSPSPAPPGSAPVEEAQPAVAVRLRVRGEIVAMNREMSQRLLGWIASEAFGTTWTVWLDVYEAVRVDADGERSEASALGILELNGSATAGLGKLRWRDRARLECTGSGRILDVLDREGRSA